MSAAESEISSPDPRSDADWPRSGGSAGRLPTAVPPRRPSGGPERVDLRLHMLRPDVVIVRVSGTVDEVTAPLVAERVGKQLHRAPHVVLDLGDVSVLGPQGLTVLLMLHQQAMTHGSRLHIVGVKRDALHARDLAQLVKFDATVDMVIAMLTHPVISRGGSGAHPR
jgi:anti-anti-sigma factor